MMLPEDRQPGWYWVQTEMPDRIPHKKWVVVELVYDEDYEDEDDSPYCWIDSNSDEFEGHIVSVGPRIPEHVGY